MARYRGVTIVDRERCKGCNLCVRACPLKVILLTDKRVNHKGYHYAYGDESGVCNGCASCAVVCPDGCITVYKMKEE